VTEPPPISLYTLVAEKLNALSTDPKATPPVP